MGPLSALDRRRALDISPGQIVYICGHPTRAQRVISYPIERGGRSYVEVSPKVYGISIWRAWEVRTEPMPALNVNATLKSDN